MDDYPPNMVTIIGCDPSPYEKTMTWVKSVSSNHQSVDGQSISQKICVVAGKKGPTYGALKFGDHPSTCHSQSPTTVKLTIDRSKVSSFCGMEYPSRPATFGCDLEPALASKRAKKKWNIPHQKKTHPGVGL